MRRTLLVPVAAVALSLGLAAPAQAAPVTKDANQAAAGWLTTQLKDGERLQSSGYDDAGLTIDAVLAFDAVGVAGDAAAKATAWLVKPDSVANYIGDGAKESYAGAHAKLALLALAQGKDPEAVGGRKLLTELAALQEASGRYSDRSEYGNYSNTFSQSLAVIALQRTPGKAPAKAVEFLVGSQCPDGGFPQDFAQPTCTGSVDATGLVVQALFAAGKSTEAGKALDWLTARQQANGGFTSGAAVPDKDNPVNANSTGNALAALRTGQRTAAATKATTYLTGLQIGCAGPADQRGAITFDGTFTAGKAPRATAGALFGLANGSLNTVSNKDIAAAAPSLDCTVPATATPTPTAGPVLPVTGSPASLLAWAGAAMLALGACTVALARRRRSA
ncbi:LPXTG cell wall anchor domain-containing protein [Longispora urticae]